MLWEMPPRRLDPTILMFRAKCETSRLCRRPTDSTTYCQWSKFKIRFEPPSKLELFYQAVVLGEDSFEVLGLYEIYRRHSYHRPIKADVPR